jgi:hypothetical protein
VPRKARWALDAKNSDVWAGQSVDLIHRDIADFSGEPERTTFEVISVAPRGEVYNYEGIEYTYRPALPQDDFEEELTIIIGGDVNNLNIRTVFDSLFPEVPTDATVRFIVESAAVVGSSSTATPAIVTGSWPSGTTLIVDNRGVIAGAGGDGATDTTPATVGGPALSLGYDITLINSGVLNGGGGGGGWTEEGAFGEIAQAFGGGGAGRIGGFAGAGSNTSGDLVQFEDAQNGGLLNGGNGAFIQFIAGGEVFIAQGGNGGDIGQAGQDGDNSTGAAAGTAIITNGFTVS